MRMFGYASTPASNTTLDGGGGRGATVARTHNVIKADANMYSSVPAPRAPTKWLAGEDSPELTNGNHFPGGMGALGGAKPPAQSTQFWMAKVTQISSHVPMQHNSSNKQTSWQQLKSSQNGVPFGSQQSPASGSPHEKVSSQESQPVIGSLAVSAQIESHATSQQEGSILQIISQHSSSLQLGVPLGKQQLPEPGSPQRGIGQAASGFITVSVQMGSKLAELAQVKSHIVSQQKGSNLHTVLQHTSSSQEGVKFATQHSPAHGSPHKNEHSQFVVS